MTRLKKLKLVAKYSEKYNTINKEVKIPLFKERRLNEKR